jgi:hypothetical protein
VGHGDDLNLMRFFPIDDGKWIAVEYDALGSVQIRRIELRALLYTLDCRKKFLIESIGSIFALPGVPGVGGLDLLFGFGVVLDRFQTSSRARARGERLAIISA